MSEKPTSSDERPYPTAWDEVKEVELEDFLRATPAQRLAWLEEAMKLAWMAGAKQQHFSNLVIPFTPDETVR